MILFSGLSRFSGHFCGDGQSPLNRDTTVVGFCMMTIEPDIEQNVKKMIWQNEYLSQFLKIKILPRSNVKHSAKNRPTKTYHTPK